LVVPGAALAAEAPKEGALMFVYSIASGKLFLDGALRGQGYAGAPAGKNNPLMCPVHNIGPIPCGQWLISGPPEDTQTHGPFVLHLSPCAGTNTFGRGGFLIHGDNMSDPGNGSEGCIVMARQIREFIWNSNCRDLLVVASDDLVPNVC
jgi:hypothetical protein